MVLGVSAGMRVTILVKAVGVDCVEFSGTYIRSAVDGLCRAVPFCGVFLFLWSRLFLVSACLEQCHTGTAFLSCLVLSCLVLSFAHAFCSVLPCLLATFRSPLLPPAKNYPVSPFIYPPFLSPTFPLPLVIPSPRYHAPTS